MFNILKKNNDLIHFAHKGPLNFVNGYRKDAAPYRAVSVRDALTDLPEIESGQSINELPLGEPLSDYQKKVFLKKKGLK